MSTIQWIIKENMQVVGVVVLYWFTSISMVFVNKYLMSGDYKEYDLTIFVALCQNIVTVGIILGMRKCFPSINNQQHYTEISLDLLFHSDVLKIGFSFVISLVFNNLMLKNISVSFYQLARSFTLIFTVILSSVILKRPITIPIIVCFLLIVSGYVLSVSEEESAGTLSLLGIVYGCLASFSAAVTGIYTKKAEKILDNSPLKLTFYNNINGAIILLPLSYITNQLHSVFYSKLSTSIHFWFTLVLSGVFSFSIGWASALQIKYTSPIAHHISINAKSVMTTVLAILYYSESKSLLWWCGNVLVILGVAVYTVYQSRLSKDTGQLPTTDASKERSI